MQVWARDPNRVRKGQLTPLSAQCVLRESGVGTWSITVDESSQWSPVVQEGWGVVVMDGDTTVFSGPVTEIQVEQNGTERDVTITGVTDMHVLADRLVYPNPAQGFNAQTISHYKAKGPAETLILDMIRGQCTPDEAWVTRVRRTPGLVVPASLGRGATTSVEARFTRLLDEVKALATVGGLVVDIVQDGTDLPLTIREPADKSRSVRFMQDSGLGAYTVHNTAPTITTVILGAQGEGASRTITGKSAPNETRWGSRRIESFSDRRDTEDSDEHDKTMTEVLAEGGPAGSATFEVAETNDLRYGTHFRLGDIVSVVLPGGQTITDGVRYVEITWDPYGRDVKVTVGDESTDEPLAPKELQALKTLQRSVRGLAVRR